MLVSILIATFNRYNITTRYLPNIIKNIGNVEHEILIWDNGSKDGTLDWLLEFQKTNPNIREVVANDTNIGMQAFNPLASMAKGKYLLKVDDDVEVPANFVERLIGSFEDVNCPKLAYLSWDLKWGETTFALRKGVDLYKDIGEIVPVSDKSFVYMSKDPKKWMVNGVCRLCLKDTFLKLGGHPKDLLYGIDQQVSINAANAGFYVGFYRTKELIIHNGDDAPDYRRFKDEQLKLAKAPRHV